MACLQRFFRILTNIPSLNRLYTTQSFNKIIPLTATSIVNKHPWIWQKQTKVEIPLMKITPFELPRNGIWIPPLLELPYSEKTIIEPGNEENKHEKQAVRLIVIRRHKMKKHKLKKLRKKMKFEWAKLRQKREMRKEKLFQAELLAQIKEAEKFSAEQYVADKIKKATEVIIPDKRLQEFIIKEKLGLPPK